jgi:hypothetical protein
MGFLNDLFQNPVGAITGSTSAKRQVTRAADAANQRLDTGLGEASAYLLPYLDPGTAALGRLNAGVAPGGEFAGSYAQGFDPAAYAFNPSGLPAIPGANINPALPGTGVVDPSRYTPWLDPNINPFLPGAGFTAPNQPFTSTGFDFTADPGYNFRLGEGVKALEGSAAARGKALSGQTVKDILGFSQGLASDEYQRAYDRALGENQLAYSRALGENQQAFNRGLTVSDILYGRGSDAFNRGLTLNDLGYQRDVAANADAYNRALEQSQLQYGRGADAFNRGLTVNDILYGRQQGENQTAYDRALADSLRQEGRFYQDDTTRYNRVRDILGLGSDTARTLADAELRAAGAQAGNLISSGQAAGDYAAGGFQRLYDLLQGLGTAAIAGG